MRRAALVLLCAWLAGCAGNTQAVRSNERDAMQRAMVRVRLASEYLRLQNYHEATRNALQAFDSVPRYAPAYNVLAMISVELRDDDKARTYFRQALESAPNDSDVLHNYGWFLCERGDFKSGIQQLLAAVRNPLYPNPDRSMLVAGLCARKAGDLNEARDFLERALKYRGDNQEVRTQLAELNLQTGNTPEARRLTLEMIKMVTPPTAELLWLAVRVERKMGSHVNEQRYAEDLRKQFPDSLEASKLMAGKYE
jgi:type IV pilus assembly protein PilF